MASVVEQLQARHKMQGPGQLAKLTERMSQKQLERRTAKIAMRIGREALVTRGMLMGVLQLLNRGFFGRMKYAIFGK